jgi:hypothetical protein
MSNVLLKAFYLPKPLSNCGRWYSRDAFRRDVCGCRHAVATVSALRRLALPACHAAGGVSRATANSPPSLLSAQHAQPVVASAADKVRPLSDVVA